MKSTWRIVYRSLSVAVMLTLQISIGAASLSAIRTRVNPTIDGVLEDVWKTGTRFGAFKQIEPDILADATVRTEGYFLYDEENIYMAMKLYQRRNSIHSSRARKDADLIKAGDYVTFSLDPVGNGNTAFFFTINAENANRDGTYDEYGTENTQWDAPFNSATLISDEYWTVEVQVPLTSLSFQDKDIQEWGIRLYRHFAQNQEMAVSNLVDINNPYRLTNLDRLVGLAGLNKRTNLQLSPYIYSHNETDLLNRSTFTQGKTGGELRYTPSSSMTLLATVNPDYAQLETDKEIINVSDLPTEYPEKRPFFTQSSDFYTNAAVNTRNIVDIKAGLKIRQLGDIAKYDITGVLDGEDNGWLFGHLIIGDNTSYLAELTSGLKDQISRDDYNVTAHLMKWFFDKRLVFSHWVGTINNPGKMKNEWETVNNIRWLSRTFVAGWWSHYKTKLYNPYIVGWNYLSNEFHSMMWTKYSIINGSGLLRTASLNTQFDYFSLTSPSGHSYSTITFTQEDIFNLGEDLGNWSLSLVYAPPTNQKFRYRQFDATQTDQIFEDAFSKFTLVDDKAPSYSGEVRSDDSKTLGLTLRYSSNHVRHARADNVNSEVYWKIGGDAVVRYSLGFIDIHGSKYQDRYSQLINRLQLEYNLTERFNIRLILQPDVVRLPGSDDYLTQSLASNVTISWEYWPGSYVYLVYGRYRNVEEANAVPRSTLRSEQSVVLKINKSFSL